MRTLLCHAALIEDLLTEGYNFVLTARLQSDPLERRYGQYRQMSGGRFLVGLKDATVSEKIIKMKSLLKEGIDIDENVKTPKEDVEKLELLISYIDILNYLTDTISLSDSSREVGVHIAMNNSKILYLSYSTSLSKQGFFPTCLKLQISCLHLTLLELGYLGAPVC